MLQLSSKNIKKSQYFSRMDISKEEYEEMKNKYTNNPKLPYSEIASVLDFGLKPNPLVLLSQDDENLLYALWQDSTNKDPVLKVDSKIEKDAYRLMQRGYVIENGNRFEVTTKGKRVIVNKVLGINPKIENNNGMNKTSSLEKKSFENNFDYKGIRFRVAYPLSDEDGNVVGMATYKDPKPYSMFKKLPEEDRKNVKDLGAVLVFPFNALVDDTQQDSFIEEVEAPYPYIPTDGFMNTKNTPKYDLSSSALRSFNKYSSSKLFGMINNCGDNIIRNDISRELSKRGLNVIITANDNESREKGLMFTKPLKNNECALFIFDNPGKYAFWNKNVSYSIDVGFFDKNGSLIEVQSLSDNQLSPVYSSGIESVKYVVETAKGWFKSNNISRGSSIYEIIENFPEK